MQHRLAVLGDARRYRSETQSRTTAELTHMASLSLAVSGRLPEPDLEAVLIRAGFAAGLARWVNAHLTVGPYTHYTVSQQHQGSQTILCIDTFLLDPWIHSKTGETGESPHGCCEEFEIDTNGKVIDTIETSSDDGSTTSSMSRSISFYGG